MGRVWALAAALAVGCIVVYLTVDFMGVTALKFCSAIIGAGAAAAYLPGGNSVSRGLFMLLGVFYGSLSFILGALMFPDTNLGLLLGALTPIFAAALTATFTRSPETLLVMLLGAGAMGAIYTGDFFADPQSLNYTLPIALGQAMLLISLGYLLAVLVRSFGPKAPAAATADAAPVPEGWAPYPNISPNTSSVDETTAQATDESAEAVR